MSAPRVSHYKVVISGYIVEGMQYKNPIGYNLISSKKKATYRARRTIDKQEITESSLSRTRNTLIRLINANARIWQADSLAIEPQFITFTFKENVQDLSEANDIFTNFIKRLNYHYFDTKESVVKYVVVPEFQERGAVHYHAIFFNLPLFDKRKEFTTGEFAELWGQGFIKIKSMNNIPNVGLYMTKYMTKDATDRRLIGRKKYFSSRHLNKPDVFSTELIAGKMLDFLAPLPSIHAYITKPNKDSGYAPENPTFCATYHLNPEQLQDLRSLDTL